MFRMICTISLLLLLDACAANKAFYKEVQQQPGFILSASGTYGVVYSSQPGEIPLNQPFTLEVLVVKDKNPLPEEAVLTVDARMPQHRHGMNRQPLVTARGDGSFLVEGLLFHMPGKWEIYFDISFNGVTERVQKTVELE